MQYQIQIETYIEEGLFHLNQLQLVLNILFIDLCSIEEHCQEHSQTDYNIEYANEVKDQ
jgi:hypothetical protein